MANVSKHERLRRPPKSEFALTGILIGAFAGEALAATVEVAMGQPNRWIMLAGGIAGIALGSVFETARFWRRKRKWHEFRKP